MPFHYKSAHGEKEMKVKSTMKPEKKEPAKRSNGMRKMSEKEKKLIKEHFEKHQPNASRSDKAKVRMAVMRKGVDIKTMKGLHKLVGFM